MKNCRILHIFLGLWVLLILIATDIQAHEGNSCGADCSACFRQDFKWDRNTWQALCQNGLSFADLNAIKKFLESPQEKAHPPVLSANDTRKELLLILGQLKTIVSPSGQALYDEKTLMLLRGIIDAAPSNDWVSLQDAARAINVLFRFHVPVIWDDRIRGRGKWDPLAREARFKGRRLNASGGTEAFSQEEVSGIVMHELGHAWIDLNSPNGEGYNGLINEATAFFVQYRLYANLSKLLDRCDFYKDSCAEISLFKRDPIQFLLENVIIPYVHSKDSGNITPAQQRDSFAIQRRQRIAENRRTEDIDRQLQTLSYDETVERERRGLDIAWRELQ